MTEELAARRAAVAPTAEAVETVEEVVVDAPETVAEDAANAEEVFEDESEKEE
jgi:hypothetical protein